MTQKLSHAPESPSQTAGPYVHIGLTPNAIGIRGVYPDDLGASLFSGAAAGERISLRGRVLDGVGAPCRDAVLEIWQADAAGRHPSPLETRGGADPAFRGWARAACDAETGEYAFETIKPGAVAMADGRMMAPHISVWVVARGINIGLQTRVYFPEETGANAADPVLGRIEHKARIETLIARKTADAAYRFDIRLQGEGETVFFDL